VHVSSRRIGALGALFVAMLCCVASAGAAQLPDGRVYEMVSPVKKNGNSAGSPGYASLIYSKSDPAGDRLLYGVTGPIEGSPRGMQTYAVAERTAGGWKSTAPFPFPSGFVNYSDYTPFNVQPSEDLRRFAFTYTGGDIVPGNPTTYLPAYPSAQSGGLYITGPEGQLAWVSKPTISTPDPPVGEVERVNLAPAGVSPDLDTLYFSYTGTLVPEDASRAPNVIARPAQGQSSPRALYRWHDGELVNYGSLPDGTFDPYGSMPAGAVQSAVFNNSSTPANFNGQVTPDGKQAIFVSPDPAAGAPNPTELYVRRGDSPSILVSRSEVTGLPAASGPLRMTPPGGSGGIPSYAYGYGSSDGEHVYFVSKEALTSDAPVDTTEKSYVFDIETEDLEYLPGVIGMPVAANPDLSAFVFAHPRTIGPIVRPRVGIWQNGHATQWAEGSSNASDFKVWNGKVTADGQSFFFSTTAAMPGEFNAGFGLEQVYRYDVAQEKLSCVSCPPEGVEPESNAEMTHTQTNEPSVIQDGFLYDARGISGDGNRVFFDTGDPLVSQDSNGVRDVYEWENGKVSLISSGRSDRESYLLENSESGDDVFFATSEGLVPEDADGAYDVYDARVGGGTHVVPPPAPCSGDCQSTTGPPAFTEAGSAGLAGAGNAPKAAKKKPAHHKKKHHKKKHHKKGKSKKRARNSQGGAR
jgi:hypothetical protein